MIDSVFQIPVNWLKEPIVVYDVLARINDDLQQYFNRYKMYDDIIKLAYEKSVALHMADRWSSIYRFIKNINDDFKLYRYKSPPETWNNLNGSEGYCIIDEYGKTIALYITIVS